MESLAREVLEKTGTAIVVATVDTVGETIRTIMPIVSTRPGGSERRAKTRGS
jgi:hypothetical protein